MSSDVQRLPAIALTGRVLGALYYQPPGSPECAELIAMLASPEWVTEWPIQSAELPDIARLMAAGLADKGLDAEYQRLFIGPYALPAPPWGSVYLDKENVLFGDSMLALRQWMREHGFVQETGQNEPEDHFGTLLMLAAWLADEGQSQRLDELLAWHLLPWSERFLNLFTDHAANDFYRGLGQLAQLTLAGWQSGMLTPVAQKELFF